MAVVIGGVERDSIAHKLGIRAGDTLAAIGGHPIRDVLDYQFYLQEGRVTLDILRDGKALSFALTKDPYADIGLQFATYLMDGEQRCKNGCIFCFIDQNPPGMRESIYFKDDDERLSFLFGNYITLTNLTDREVDRIIAMRISPVNVSVHTMNPDLRVSMMRNKRAGETLAYLDRFAGAGIAMNAQLVLVPGLNDGEELCHSLERLGKYRPQIRSIACVPVGLTAHREGLPSLRPFTAAEAAAVIDAVEGYAATQPERFCYPSDEFFILAGRPIPGPDYYGDFLQLENGVGMTALFRDEFEAALAVAEAPVTAPALTLVTGEAAGPIMEDLVRRAKAALPGIQAEVVPVGNRFFGGHVTVAGLVTGSDILRQLEGRSLGEAVLFPRTMLRAEGDRFLDDMTPADLERALGVPLIPCDNDGGVFLDRLLGIE